MKLQESGEMYLEAVYVLSQKSQAVRAIDIAEYLNYSKPSVSRALGILKDEGLIKKDSANHIALTKAGKILAERIYERHTVLSKMLSMLGVDEETAIEDACRIEHYISDTSFKAIKAHMKQYEKQNARI